MSVFIHHDHNNNSMVLIILYFLGALSLSFLCSVLEAVLLSTPVSFISMKEAQGNGTAALLRQYKDNVDRPVGAILSINTVAHTIGSAGVGAESMKIFGEEYFGVISALLTLLILVFSEIIPKTLGASYWRTLAMPAARIIRVMIIVTYPLVLLSEQITRWFSPKDSPLSVSREEVSAMVDVGADEGVFGKEESRIIKSCMHLVDVTAREIMTPRTVMELAEENMTLQEFSNEYDCSFSRIPVYHNDKDYITGYVLKDRILKELSEDRFDLRLADIARPVLSFAENESAFNIWEKMLEAHEHIAVITDEYGCLRGIVTMEDVLESMTGVEIVDEQDKATDMQALAKEKCKRRTNTM